MNKKAVLVALFATVVMLSFTGCAEKKELFNGIDTRGWISIMKSTKGVNHVNVFKVKDGNIHITGNPFGYMRTTEKYGDYDLHVEWRWVGEGTNSGIFLHVQDGDKLWPNAIECQLCSGKAGDFVMLGGSKIREVECKEEFPVKDRKGDFEKPVGEWNAADIKCRGNKIKVYINGEFQNECTSDSTEGFIALQSEGGPIEFRNIILTKK